jgi:ABC-type polar amino acid transport system ATPase subunit
MLEMKNVSKKVGRSLHIADVSMTLEKGSVNILLGPTLSGKTSLMRLMAGLDRPDIGPDPDERNQCRWHAGSKAQCRDGVPAVHQLSGHDGL